METLKTIPNPNFSIILPGPCNNRCRFCFWKRDKDENPYTSNYAWNLNKLLSKLPEQFNQISITGGEPVISRHLFDTLKVLREHKDRFRKVVLTTSLVRPATVCEDTFFNHLEDWFAGVVTNVNVSFHHYAVGINVKILRTRNGNVAPTVKPLKDFIEAMNRRGIPVNANCVLTDAFIPKRVGKHDREEMIAAHNEVLNYVEHAAALGFSSVAFRKPHTKTSGLRPHLAEEAFLGYEVVRESSCPVCVAKTQIIKGMYVTWKRSVAEPSDNMPNLIYELVYHPDETLSADWGKNIIVEV